MNMLRRAVAVALVLAFALVHTSLAQQPTTSVKYWILLNDKVGAAGKTTIPETDYLSDRALERRRQRGTITGLSATLDAPLSPVYLDALQRRGIKPLVQSRWLNAVSARLDARQVGVVRKLPFVRGLRPVGQALPAQEHPAFIEETPALPLLPRAVHPTLLDYGPSQTQLEVVNAIPPLELGINGTGVRFGLLDTEFGGFQHPAFARLVSENRLLADSNFVGQSQGSRHGRSVASIAFGFDEGNLIGPAHGAEVLAATTEFSPTETNQEEDNLVAGLEWMEAQGVDVVNISLGYNEFDGGQHSYTPADLDGDTGITTIAADRAASLGVVVVTSAGNEGDDPWRFITTPADGDSVITVGSVSSSGTKSGFSSIGPTADGRFKPDVAALGEGVQRASSNTGYGRGQGTSFSSPMVAGVVAQMLQVNPNLAPMEILGILRATASQADAPDNRLGWGIINADAAVQEAERCRNATIQCARPTGVDEEATIPSSYEVLPPYPNPFSEQTVFEVQAPAGAGMVRMSVYNLLGQRVGVPFEGPLHPGLNRIVFESGTLPAGLYLYSLQGDRVSMSGTMILVR
ncbi:MAG: S8 family peptidase [Rhodothermales bacterium]